MTCYMFIIILLQKTVCNALYSCNMDITDLLIVHSQDGLSWAEYFLGFFKKLPGITASSIFDEDLIPIIEGRTSHNCPAFARTFIIILTPGHIEFLKLNAKFSYADVVTTPNRSQLFLLSVSLEDLDPLDSLGSPLYQRFPNFDVWGKLEIADEKEVMRNALQLIENDDLVLSPVIKKAADQTQANGGKTRGKNGSGKGGNGRKRQMEFLMSPDRISCQHEEDTEVFLIFTKPLREDDEPLGKVDVYLTYYRDHQPYCRKSSLKDCNPYTCSIRLSPSRIPQEVEIKVEHKNSVYVGTKRLVYYPQQVQPSHKKMKLESKHCCPGGSGGGSGMSVGTILCILLIVLLSVYLIGGILYMHYVKHAEGVQKIPNYSFWVEMPGLVKDGFLMVVRPVRSSLFGYQEI